MEIYDVIIIGGGPAGATAALYTARAGLKTVVVDKGLTAGALGVTGRIANYPGLTEEVTGAELLERMREQARSFGAEFISDKVIGVDLKNDPKMVFCNQHVLDGRIVIIATGSMGRGNKIKGEDEFVGKGVSYCAVCDAAFFKDQEVLVAGSSDEAIEEGLYLTRFASRVHFLNPSDELIAPKELVEELEANPKVTLYKEAKLKEIGGNGKVDSVRFELKGAGEQTLPISGAFIYLQGGRPITDFLEGQLEISEKGCLMVDHEQRTSIPGVYAVGDVLCEHIKQVIIAAGEGALAGMSAEKALRGRRQIVVDWAK
jgi:thioredoxin reductase (NADPH)